MADPLPPLTEQQCLDSIIVSPEWETDIGYYEGGRVIIPEHANDNYYQIFIDNTWMRESWYDWKAMMEMSGLKGYLSQPEVRHDILDIFAYIMNNNRGNGSDRPMLSHRLSSVDIAIENALPADKWLELNTLRNSFERDRRNKELGAARHYALLLPRYVVHLYTAMQK